MRTLLKTLLLGLFLFGFAMSSYPFVTSMFPTDAVVDMRIKEVDVSTMEPGQLLETKLYDQPIWIYRRTPDQLEWLETHTPTKVASFIMNTDKAILENDESNYRSKNPEYFIFRAFRTNKIIYLNMDSDKRFYSCGTIQCHSIDMTLDDGRLIKGIIACQNHHDFVIEKNRFAYDITGMPLLGKYMHPLNVPRHDFKGVDKVVFGPTL